MSGEHKTIHIIVKGKVQGVGFRASAKHEADKLQVKGSAKNLSDGSVEIYAQGTEDSLDRFIENLKSSKGLALIENFSIEDYSQCTKTFQNFEIIF